MDTVSQEEFFGNATVSQSEFFQPQVSQEPTGSFKTDFGEDLFKRRKIAEEIVNAQARGEIGWARAAFQMTGKVGAGGFFDFMTNGIEAVGRLASKVTPDSLEERIKESAGNAFMTFLETDIGQAALWAAREGAPVYEEFKKENPNAARDVESLVNIGLLAAPAIDRGIRSQRRSLLDRASSSAANSADDQIIRERKAFLEDLVKPAQTKAVREEQVDRTIEVGSGLLKRKQVQLSPRQTEVANTLLDLPAVSPKNTLQGNFNIINREVSREAERLRAALTKGNFTFPRKEYKAVLESVDESLAKNFTLTGDAQRSAQSILKEAKELFRNEPSSSAVGLLNVRQALDRSIRSQKGSGVFDPVRENAASIAIREIRTATNNFMASKASTVPVTQSLARQSKLYTALDTIKPLAADEAATAIGRVWGRALKILPFRSEFNNSMAAIFGIGGLGASAAFAPYFTAGAAGAGSLYFGVKAISSVTAKRALSTLLSGIDDGLKSIKDRDVLLQLRTDRALVSQLLRDFDNDLETN